MIKYVKAAKMWCVTKREFNQNNKKEVFTQTWVETKKEAVDENNKQ